MSDVPPSMPPAQEPVPPPPPSMTPERVVGGRPDNLTRFLAYFIDAVIAAVVGLVPLVGGLVAIAYALVKDGLTFDFMDGRSIGKKLMKIRPVREDGLPMDVRTSVQRNWPLALGALAQFLLIIPVLGWVLFPFVVVGALIIVILEIIRVVNSPDGRRWGDQLARTRVVVTEN